ncbi:hypothetical protein J2W18_004987 [Rhodococcus cercidiphylli]|nr:hypothetical protein [Rhodococcus cercidiphylli]
MRTKHAVSDRNTQLDNLFQPRTVFSVRGWIVLARLYAM